MAAWWIGAAASSPPAISSLLAAVPACLKRFFKPVSKISNGVEHIVIGTQTEAGADCIRDSVALRRFLLDALKYSLAVSMSKFSTPAT